MQKEYSILIGGQAGDGIKYASNTVAKLFNRLGYWIFIYIDYPSLIRGGHNFAIVRAKSEKVLIHKNKIDILIALNQETVKKHIWRLKKGGVIIFDSNSITLTTKGFGVGVGIPLGEIVKNKGLPQISRNIAAFGALGAVLGIEFPVIANIIKGSLKKMVKENIEAAKETYELAKNSRKFLKLSQFKNPAKPLLTGNEAIALGAVKAGLKAYIAYPMTPATGILHYLAQNKDKLNILTVHPENEIGAIGMAQGASYAGIKTMVGTSGGGFALMIEHLSLAGQAEIPTVIVISQRPGPATGVPTYTSQADLFFSLYAGHGEFPRVVLAPGDIEEAFYLAGESLNLAWKFRIPVILLSDKHLSESVFSAQLDETKIVPEKLKLSQLKFPGQKNVIVKSSGYECDEFGITTEDPKLIIKGYEKRLKKFKEIEKEIKKKETVKVYGNKKSKTVLVTWGSTKGAVIEAAETYNLKVIQPLYLSPFPVWEIKKHLNKAKKVISIEVNSTGQLGDLLKFHGFKVDKKILKYDGRPFTPDELEKEIKNL